MDPTLRHGAHATRRFRYVTHPFSFSWHCQPCENVQVNVSDYFAKAASQMRALVLKSMLVVLFQILKRGKALHPVMNKRKFLLSTSIRLFVG